MEIKELGKAVNTSSVVKLDPSTNILELPFFLIKDIFLEGDRLLLVPASGGQVFDITDGIFTLARDHFVGRGWGHREFLFIYDETMEIDGFFNRFLQEEFSSSRRENLGFLSTEQSIQTLLIYLIYRIDSLWKMWP